MSVDRLRRRRPALTWSDDPEQEENNVLPSPAILTDWSSAPESLLDSAEAQFQLDTAIASLPDRLRAVFLLRDVEGLSTAEVAQILDISISAAKVRLHRARLQLRERLSDYFSERLSTL